ncbi:MAG TPA: pyrroloquinoline quinone biosynthesis protein PqqB [Burkholderiales bacterium]
MKISVLGAAAGGGFPQWNCNCPNCAGVRRGTRRAEPRTQSSIAATDGSGGWVLFNASPDILTQIRRAPFLQPGRAVRDTAIAGIVLIDAQIDHTTGLLMLREGRPLDVWCTDPVHADLTRANPVFEVLSHYCTVRRHRIVPDGASAFAVPGVSGLAFTAIALSGKAPPYSPSRNRPQVGDNIGVMIQDLERGRRLFYAPALAEITPAVHAFMERADCLMVDGTFWADDEMIRLGISDKRARDLGHLPQSGPEGMIEALAPFSRARKILIHINNTNPILDEDSPERAALARAGIEVAADGMEIEL